MQGAFVNGRRPATKSELQSAIKVGNLEAVELEATSLFGNEYGGPVGNAPSGDYYIVGPDPHKRRVWYATITVKQSEGGRRVTIA